MSGYHNVVLPGKYSEGSVYAVGFDTRVTELENGQEERMVRYAPQGRRKYQIARGITGSDDAVELYRFFLNRSGAANSFKFLDVMDHSTTASNRTTPYSAEVPSPTDMFTQFISGTSYQCTTRYDDGQGHHIVRPITKLKTDVHPVRVALDGIEIFGPDFLVDTETGVIWIDPVNEYNSVKWGGDYYTPVRFSQATDEAFRVSMPSSQSTMSLPNVELVEEISPAIVSQDFHFGGSFELTNNPSQVFIDLTPINGRIQSITPASPNSFFRLPPLLDMPEGGPIMVLHCGVGPNSLAVYTADNQLLTTVTPNTIQELWVGTVASGGGTSKTWFAIQ